MAQTAEERKIKRLEAQVKTLKEKIAEQEKIRKSALAKLAALGLTEDEIAAL